MKLNLKLIIILLEISLIPMSFLAFAAYSNTQKEITNEVISRLESIADIQKARFENSDKENLERLTLLTSRLQLRIETENYITHTNTTSQDKIKSILTDALQAIPSIKEILVLDVQGNVITTTSSTRSKINQKSTEYFKLGLIKNNTTLFSKDSHGDVSILSTGPLTLNGKTIGVLVVNSVASNINTIVASYTGLGTTGETILVQKNNHGDAIFLSQTRFDPHSALTRIVSKQRTRVPSVHADNGEELVMPNSVDYRGIPVIAVTRYIPALKWGIVVNITQAEAYAPIKKLRNLLIFIISASSLIIAIISFSLAKSLSDPIKKLTEFSLQISSGDLSKRLKINSNDEIGTLATTFNTMTEKLQIAYQKLEQTVTARTQELSSNVSELEIAKKATLNLLEDLVDEKGISEQQKNILSSLLENMPIGAMLMEAPSGRITMLNKEGARLFGKDLAPDSTKGNYLEIFDLQKSDGKPYPKADFPAMETLRTGTVATKEDIFIRKANGIKINIRLTSAPIKNKQGEIKLVASVFEDVTKEKTIDRMKTEFISLASHQLRTPLTAIKWFSEMLLSDDAGHLQPEQKEFATNIAQSTERMIELVNSLLNISRIESGRIVIDPKPTDIKELVAGIINDLKAKTEERQQKMIISIHEGLPKINVDPKLLGQVYLNLLTNAIKYTPIGGEISVIISKKEDQLISQVSDSGYGIPKAQQDRVFQKFFRADNIVKVESDGTGLGLYLIKSIIDSSGGKIWFESEENKGTTFWFSLPMTGMVAKAGDVLLGFI